MLDSPKVLCRDLNVSRPANDYLETSRVCSRCSRPFSVNLAHFHTVKKSDFTISSLDCCIGSH